jgi:flagellar motility protein MotE (MotC chaperone)
MATYEEDHKDIDDIEERLQTARKRTTDRVEKVDDLTSRFRELRHKNHFRLMLEEIFND